MRIDTADYAFGHLTLGSDDYDEVMKWLDQFEPGEWDIKKHRQKRSVSANAYLWHLCEEIAKATGDTKVSVYRRAIREVGVYEPIKLDPKVVAEFNTAISSFGIGYFVEVVDAEPDGMILVNYYKGSSEYDSKQFSRLVDSLVEDAKALGIETLTEKDLSRLKEEFGG